MSAPNPASPSRQPQQHLQPQGGPTRKHGKKKSRSSWKAGFKSTPSSPSQTHLDGRTTALAELPYASTTDHNKLEHAPLTTDTPGMTNRNPQTHSDREGKENRPPPQSQPSNPKLDASIKDNKTNDINTTKTIGTATTVTSTGKGASMPRKTEFLQNLDIQLIKLQREEGGQGTPSGSKDTKPTSEIPSVPKSGNPGKVFDHELSQLLKAPASVPSGSGENSQGTRAQTSYHWRVSIMQDGSSLVKTGPKTDSVLYTSYFNSATG